MSLLQPPARPTASSAGCERSVAPGIRSGAEARELLKRGTKQMEEFIG
jgi:hypothetical protein